MNVLQCTATQCMCYKDIQMEEGTFKRKKDILSSYSTESIFYLSTIQRLYKGLTFIYGLPRLGVVATAYKINIYFHIQK